jgi:hypothetical protein
MTTRSKTTPCPAMTKPTTEHHAALLKLARELADYGTYLRDRRRPPLVRAIGHGIRDRIRAALDEQELGK